MVQIRKIEVKDNQAMERIIKQSLESFDLDIPGTAYYDPQLSYLEEFYRDKINASYWVAVNEKDDVLGGVGIGPFGQEADVGELQKLYVTPEVQGRGIAKKLMDVALDFAKDHYTYCYLETSHKLETANLLYSKLGFVERDKPLEGSEHGTMDKWYIKELS